MDILFHSYLMLFYYMHYSTSQQACYELINNNQPMLTFSYSNNIKI